jgi:cobalamin biosynthetic protein CobC
MIIVPPYWFLEALGEVVTYEVVDSSLPVHGGDIAAAVKRYGIPHEQWLDLSTGINPCAYPVGTFTPDVWQALPDKSLEIDVLDAARSGYGVADGARIVAAPGTQALIQWLPRLISAQDVAVVSPTYSEHAGSWTACGATVREVSSLSEGDDAEVLIVVNPNNPNGRMYEPLDLLRRAEGRARQGRWIIVDEAFCDVTPELSLARKAGAPGLIVLRSFGKFFGLAGARLGFALCPQELGDRLSAAMGPWAVSGPAAVLGARALRDADWIEATRQSLADMTRSVDALIHDVGMTVLGGTNLFRLTHFEQAVPVYHALAKRGVLTRAYAACPQWIRFGLPADQDAFHRLDVALRAAVAEVNGA